MNGNLKGCQKKLSQLHRTIVLLQKITDIHNSKIALKFEGNCLKQDKVSFAQRNMVNIFVVYEVNTWSRNLKADLTFKGCLLGAVN